MHGSALPLLSPVLGSSRCKTCWGNIFKSAPQPIAEQGFEVCVCGAALLCPTGTLHIRGHQRAQKEQSLQPLTQLKAPFHVKEQELRGLGLLPPCSCWDQVSNPKMHQGQAALQGSAAKLIYPTFGTKKAFGCSRFHFSSFPALLKCRTGPGGSHVLLLRGHTVVPQWDKNLGHSVPA